MRFGQPSHEEDDDAPAVRDEPPRGRHDWYCEPWQAPYGIEWRCHRCGLRVAQSLVVLSDPERLRSTATVLDAACSASTAGASLRR